MYKLVSDLILYSNIKNDPIMNSLCRIYEDWEEGHCSKVSLKSRVNSAIKSLLDLSTAYGFDTNLWHNYLTFMIITDENSFSMTCEGVGGSEGGSVNSFARNDFAVFKELFEFDFAPLENDLEINAFSVLGNYKAISKTEKIYDKDVSVNVQALSLKIAAAKDADEIFNVVTDFYKAFGVGMFGLHKAFRIGEHGGAVEFIPVSNADTVRLDDLVGYERQKAELRRNTKSFVDGKKANNVLLYGDAGTGKSTSIKAILNEYYPEGLRMIEIYKFQFHALSEIIARIKKRNYKFIIYIDDLSFEENEVEYKFLKAVIEGGVENRPDNILIYATSNRRHLVKETWKDRSDMEFDGDVHRSETMEEKLSLAARFGISINYPSPAKQEFNDIVLSLAQRSGVDMSEEDLLFEANKWELRHGGLSGRTASQFINYLLGK